MRKVIRYMLGWCMVFMVGGTECLVAEGFEEWLTSSWRLLSWQEQAQCGTTVAKGLIDLMKNNTEHHLHPALFWSVTLADDTVNVYNAFQRKDHELYSVLWLVKDFIFAIKDIIEEPSLDDLDLLDHDDEIGEGYRSLSFKKAYPRISPLVEMILSLYTVISRAPEKHKQRVLAQSAKSLVRCGRWYLASADLDKKSLSTRTAVACGLLNAVYFCKHMCSTFPTVTASL